jgi:cell division protein FtsI/penicillin-binding protein 2
MSAPEKQLRMEKRFELITLFFAFCFFIAIVNLLRYSVQKRSFFLEKCSETAWITKVVPAVRGTILDKNGIPLAWSEKIHDLKLGKAISSALRLEITREIESNLNCEIRSQNEIIRKNISPGEMLILKNLLQKNNGALEIITRTERRTVDYFEIKELFGKIPDIKKINGKKNLFSHSPGLEEIHDAVLRGSDGVFKVMLNRNRQQIPETFETIKPYQKGADVKLKSSIEELIKGGSVREAK